MNNFISGPRKRDGSICKLPEQEIGEFDLIEYIYIYIYNSDRAETY